MLVILNCRHYSKAVFLSDKVLDKLSEKHGCPIIIYGSSGKGKTALVAKIAEIWQGKDSTAVFCRFLGTSPNSSHIHNVLQVSIRS